MRTFICIFRAFVICATVVVFAGIECAAQSNFFQSPYGLSQNGAYASYKVDNVNMINGNLFVDIPLYSLPQLGKLNLSFSAVANSVGWQKEETCNSNADECQYFYINPQPGYISPVNGYNWSYVPVFAVGPIIANDSFAAIGGPYQVSQVDMYGDTAFHNDWTVVDQTGASHMLIYDASNYAQLRTTDGSGYLFSLSGNSDPYWESSGSYTLLGKNGIKTISNASAIVVTQTDPSIAPSSPYSNTITLSNGNYTDTLNRSFQAPPTTYTTSSTQGCPTPQGENQPTIGEAQWVVPGPNNGQVTYLICYADVNIHTDFWGNQGQTYYYQDLGPDYNIWNYEDDESVGTTVAIQSIVLPDGSYYEFTYQSADTGSSPSDSYPYIAYGSITQIHLPQGGTLNYAYRQISACATGGAIGVPGIASRTATDINGHSNTWNYGFGQNSGTTNVMTDPGGNDTAYTLLTSPAGSSCPNYVQTQTTYQGSMTSGVPLETTQNSYTFTATPLDAAGAAYGNANSLVTSTTTTLNNSVSATTAIAYDSGIFSGDAPDCSIGYGQTLTDPCSTVSAPSPVALSMSFPTSSTVSDYSGAVLKKTTETYAWQSYNSQYWSGNTLNTPVTDIVYDANNNEVAGTTFTYDGTGSCGGASGLLTSTSQWNNSGPSPATNQSWNCHNGKISSVTDANSNVTSRTYENSDTGSFPVTVTHPQTNGVQHIDQYTWDENTGNMLTHVNWNGVTDKFSYDSSLGRLTLSQKALNTSVESDTSYTYPNSAEIDTASDLHATRDGLLTSRTYFDGLGHAILTKAPNAAYVRAAYDYFGQTCASSNLSFSDPGVLSCSSSQNPNLSSPDGISYYSRDPLGRTLSYVHPDGAAQSWGYNGNVVTFTDEALNHWQRTSDALGRLTQVVEPGSLYTTYQYNALGNLWCADQWGTSSVGSPCTSSRHRYFEYDSLSRMTFSANPENGVIYYTYDANGNVITKIEGRNITTGFSYDALNRLTLKNHWQGGSQIGQPEGFGYDGKDEWGNTMVPAPTYAVGSLTHSSNEVNVAENYFYDPQGRLIKEFYCTPQDCSYTHTVQAQYDFANNLTSLTYPDGSFASQNFDAAGRLSTVGYSYWNGTSYVPANYLTVNSYDAPGRVTSSSLGNGMVTTSASYNSRSEIGSLTYNTTPATVWSKLYTWTPNGNLQQTTDPLTGTTRMYGYDALNRITSALDVTTGTQNPAPNGLSENYTYDAFGNLWESGNFTFWPVQYTNGNEPYGATFDAAGNLLNDGLGNSFTWDEEGRISTANGVTYSYNADGDRVGKSGSGSTDTIYFGGRPVARLSGSTWTNLLYSGSTFMAEVQSTQPGTPAYRLTDHLGSAIAMITTASPPFNIQDYAPFGQLFNGSSFDDPFKFTGKERDAESGNDYFGARYYASTMGRFLSPDPSGLTYADITNPQSFNLYSYALNNPLRNIDPTGLYCFYGGKGDTVQNDSDPTDYDFTSDGSGECSNTGGQWIDNPSSTVTVSAGGDNGNTLSTFPSDVSQNYQFIPGKGCSGALKVAGKTPQGVARADANWSVLSGAASANDINPKLLAAVGVRETDFRNIQEVLKGGKPGPGMGVFQLTNQPGVSPAQAFNVPFAANKAASMLSSNMNYLSDAFSFTPAQLLQATAASYNLGAGGISGNPSTIDNGSANGNYGSNVVNLMDCF